MSEAPETHDFSGLWAIHAERDGQPWMRDWAKDKAAAEARMKEIQAEDEGAEQTEYWVIEMTKAEVEMFKDSGFIPQDA